MRLTPRLAVVLLIPALLSGQTADKVTVSIDLLVQDGARNPALNLKPEELVLVQNGVRQVIDALEAAPQAGRYELRYTPASGQAGEVKLSVLRKGFYARGLDGPSLKPRVTTALEAELLKILASPPAHEELRVHAAVLRFESTPEGLHHTLAVEVPFKEVAGREREGQFVGRRLQMLARVLDSSERVVYRSSLDRALSAASPDELRSQRLVWTGQVHLPAGRYVFETVARDADTQRACVRRVPFQTHDTPPGVRVSSVALLLPGSLTVRDKGREGDDPLFLKGEPLMPTLEVKTVAGTAAKVEFFTTVYPDPASQEPVTLRLDLVRDNNIVGSAPLAVPAADERGQIRYAGALPIRSLPPAEYRLRLLAQQGGVASFEEASFTVLAEADATQAPVRIGTPPPAAPVAPAAPKPAAAPATAPAGPAPTPGLPDSPELAQARQHLRRHQYELAVEKLKKADEAADKQRGDVALLLSIAYYRLGAYKNAEAPARRAIELTRDDAAVQAEAHLVLARSLAFGEKKDVKRDSERLIGAEDAFRKALAASQGRMESAHLGLAETLYRLERADEARTSLEALLKAEGLSEGAVDRAQQLLANPRCATEPCLPKLSFVSADGEHLTAADLKGKVVMLSFWATWCGPCVAAMPDLKRLHAKYEKEPFIMVGVNRDHDRAAMARYLEQNGVRWPQIVDDASDRLNEAMGVRGIPAEIIFDHEGVLIDRTSGWGEGMDVALSARIHSAIGKAKKAQRAAGTPSS